MIFLAFKQALHLGDIVKNTRVRDMREKTRLWGVGSRKGELENFRAGHLGLLSINFNFWNVIFLADGISLHLGEVQMKIYERSLQALLLSAPHGFAARTRVLTRLALLAQIGELARRVWYFLLLHLWAFFSCFNHKAYTYFHVYLPSVSEA